MVPWLIASVSEVNAYSEERMTLPLFLIAWAKAESEEDGSEKTTSNATSRASLSFERRFAKTARSHGHRPIAWMLLSSIARMMMFLSGALPP